MMKPLEIVYADIIVTRTVAGRQQEEYMLHVVDDCSSMDFVFPLRQKSDTLDALLTWVNQAEHQTGLKLGVIRADNGGELTKLNFTDYLKMGGIILQTSAPYTSAHITR